MADAKRPMTIDDLYRINNVEDPQISPDGKSIAYVRVTLDKFDNTYHRNIWLSATDGSEPIQLTRSNKDSHPRWSPDGKTLMFVSSRGEKPQVYLLPVGEPGGEARVLTSVQNGALAPEWSADGVHIAFLSPMRADEREQEDSGEEQEAPKDSLEAKHRKERQEQDDKERLDPYFMWRIPYREGTRFRDGRFAQIYVMPVAEGDEKAKPRRLTNVDADHSPGQWSPDGHFIYTSRQIDPANDEPFRDSGLYRIVVESGEATLLTDDSHTCFSPVPSPDGQWLAYARLPLGGGGTLEANVRLTVMPAEGGESRDLNIELDRSVNEFEWVADSDALIFSIDDYGDVPICKVSVDGDDVEKLVSGTFKANAFSIGGKGELAFSVSTPVNPGELYYLPAGQTEHTVMTDFNKAFLDEVVVQETHELRFKNTKGEEVQGWYLLPVGYEEGQKYPLALNIHGGPHAMWGPGERTMFHEWQVHAARGYAVFYCNPHGSGGYGEAYTRALHSAWGDVAHDDVMSGVDAFLELGFVDEARMAVTGGSYGGYMTAWVVGHTDRFASAVTQRGVYNLTSFYGTSDVPALISQEFDVEPWEDPDKLWYHSPLAYAHKIKTPILIIHAENDYRVPIEQAEQLFAFVRRSGGTTEMWRYPRDGHELSRSGEPKHRVSRLERMIAWFDKYCQPQESSE